MHSGCRQNAVRKLGNLLEVLEKCALNTGFVHSTELGWISKIMALFREVCEVPVPDTTETICKHTD